MLRTTTTTTASTMDPFKMEEKSIPPVSSLRSKFEQLATAASLAPDAVKRPPPPAPTGIKRPPPPPPASQPQQPQPLPIQPSPSTSLRVSPPTPSTSPGRAARSNGSSPAVSPLLRPVPAPPSLNGSSPRPLSSNGAGSDTSLYDEMEELPSKKSKL